MTTGKIFVREVLFSRALYLLWWSKRKYEKVWRAKFSERLDKRSRIMEAARVKKYIGRNPVIKFYEIRYAYKHDGRKVKSESTGVRSSS